MISITSLNLYVRDFWIVLLRLPLFSRGGHAHRGAARKVRADRGLGLRLGLGSGGACGRSSLPVSIHSAGTGDGLGDGLPAAQVGCLGLAPGRGTDKGVPLPLGLGKARRISKSLSKRRAALVARKGHGPRGGPALRRVHTRSKRLGEDLCGGVSVGRETDAVQIIFWGGGLARCGASGEPLVNGPRGGALATGGRGSVEPVREAAAERPALSERAGAQLP